MSMEEFTRIERSHYDTRVGVDPHGDEQALFAQYQAEIAAHPLRKAHEAWLAAARGEHAARPKAILDYCAGRGFQAVMLQRFHEQSNVVAIDISGTSLEYGRRLSETLFDGNRPTFEVMDGHKLDFDDETFDFISDYGSLSSLDFDKAVSEVCRVLKPGGTFIALETLGHHPIGRMKRRWNVLRKTRTAWAASHIMTMGRLRKLSERFPGMTFQFFGLSTLAYGAFPLRSEGILRSMEQLDEWLFSTIPSLKKYGFKVLAVGKKPVDA